MLKCGTQVLLQTVLLSFSVSIWHILWLIPFALSSISTWCDWREDKWGGNKKEAMQREELPKIRFNLHSLFLFENIREFHKNLNNFEIAIGFENTSLY